MFIFLMFFRQEKILAFLGLFFLRQEWIYPSWTLKGHNIDLVSSWLV